MCIYLTETCATIGLSRTHLYRGKGQNLLDGRRVMLEDTAHRMLALGRTDVAVEPAGPIEKDRSDQSLIRYIEGTILMLGAAGLTVALTAFTGGESPAKASESHGTSSCSGDGGRELVNSSYVYYPDGDNVDVETAAGCLYRETVEDVYCEGNQVNKDTAQGYPDDAACQWQELWR